MNIEQDVTFQSGSLHLAGTLVLPDSEGRWPGVVLIPGSGPVDRNENVKRLPIDALREIAAYLARQGIATLRYDKRGVGASEGDYYDAGFFDNVSDASAALSYLKAHEHIRPELVFLLGHSEGALIATRLAGTRAGVAGVVLLAGSARPGEDLMQWQGEQVVNGMQGLNKWLIDLLHIDVKKAQQKQLDKIKRSTGNWYRRQLLIKVNAKWMREFLAYNPADDMPNIHVPVLAITGSKDIQVDPEDLERMAELVPAAFEGHEVPDLTHILRAERGQPTLSTYKDQVRQPVDERVLTLVSDWLKEHTPTQAPAAT
jgi:pimeloyl-ACP methyl ester carboxylesterase